MIWAGYLLFTPPDAPCTLLPALCCRQILYRLHHWIPALSRFLCVRFRNRGTRWRWGTDGEEIFIDEVNIFISWALSWGVSADWLWPLRSRTQLLSTQISLSPFSRSFKHRRLACPAFPISCSTFVSNSFIKHALKHLIWMFCFLPALVPESLTWRDFPRCLGGILLERQFEHRPEWWGGA